MAFSWIGAGHKRFRHLPASLVCRGKLNDYEKEFRELKNQEVTIENLKLTVQQYQAGS